MSNFFLHLIETNEKLITALIALLAIFISSYSLLVQRVHNRRSFKPFCRYELFTTKNSIKILIWNKGSGPLIIKNLTVKNNNQEVKHTIKGFIPADLLLKAPGNSAFNFRNHILLPQENITLFESSSNDNSQAIDEISKIIKNLTVTTKYKGIYPKIFPFVWKDKLF